MVDSDTSSAKVAPMKLKVVELNPLQHKKCSLTEREQIWLETYLNTGSTREACEAAGYHPNQGSQLRRRLNHFILANMKDMIAKCAPAALEVIFEIATKCPDPKTRLQAAQDLLNRAGYKEAQRHEISVTDKSDEELERELAELLKRSNIIDIPAER
ncbi:hypothetical protein D6779_00685 [Candidatus Parcubacteria bacterium]|nr:MAG: hypothetical protein D6779_00685 [Candidatus Parcubacteria bacterium]